MLFRTCAIAAAFYILSGNTARCQDIINLFPGEMISNGTVVPSGTVVNVLGGSIGLGVDLSNGALNVESGQVASGATGIPSGFTNTNNTVTVSGGTVGGFFQLTSGTELTLLGGQLESFGVFSGSTANITGGTVTRFPDVFSTGTVNISGGDVFAVRIFSGATLKLFGTDFVLDGSGVDIAVNEQQTIAVGSGTLAAVLQDGSFFETTLGPVGSFGGTTPGGFGVGAILTITRVAALGDLNGDGNINLLDVAAFVDALSSGVFVAEADINRDGSINLLDVQPFVDLLAG